MSWWSENEANPPLLHANDNEAPPPTVAVLTAYFGSSLKLRDLTFPNKVQYAKQHRLHIEDGYSSSPLLKAKLDATMNKGPAAGDVSGVGVGGGGGRENEGRRLQTNQPSTTTCCS
jgi:hypothetical protein